MIGLFFENGPFRFSPTKISLNANSWNKHANILFLDQPIGTGFSWTNGNKVTNSLDAAKDLHIALEEFFLLFPEMKMRDFYFSGESYAAKWIPHLFNEIKVQNKLQLAIRGALIESATFDPSIQHSVYADVGYYMGITNYRDYVDSNELYEKCLTDIEKKNWVNAKDRTCTPLFAERLIHKSGLSVRNLNGLNFSLMIQEL
jgi:carboxypeptidase C (cathepsin A)